MATNPAFLQRSAIAGGPCNNGPGFLRGGCFAAGVGGVLPTGCFALGVGGVLCCGFLRPGCFALGVLCKSQGFVGTPLTRVKLNLTNLAPPLRFLACATCLREHFNITRALTYRRARSSSCRPRAGSRLSMLLVRNTVRAMYIRTFDRVLHNAIRLDGVAVEKTHLLVLESRLQNRRHRF
jgi:hypothetical protein